MLNKWPVFDRNYPLTGPRPHGLANQMLADLRNYEFDTNLVSGYPEAVRREVALGAEALRRIPEIKAKLMFRPTLSTIREAAVYAEDALERDQSVWQLIQSAPDTAVETLIQSIERAPSERLAISALIALHKVAHFDSSRVLDFLGFVEKTAEVEIAEWARTLGRDLAASADNNLALLAQPVSEREFNYDPEATFDATMPLIFHCDAYTKIGPTTWHTVVSPAWFQLIFGDAMALIRQETYMTNLVLEKSVPGLHKDGSAHYEHFPFCGESEVLSPGIYKHNYWANLHRPFYTSGRAEVVGEQHPVLRSVPMTFFRAAVTAAPERYQVNDRPIPENVRGMFMGYGHIDGKVLMENRMALRAGEFQLTPSINPATGEPANTVFCGTFFGKLKDTTGDGKLDVNTIPVHCDAEGRLDYHGDGAYAPDPVCPEDWTGMPAAQ